MNTTIKSATDSNQGLESVNTADSSGTGLTRSQYQQKMQRRKEIQEQRLAKASKQKGLIVVHTGNGKGKT
ncbi:MAG: cob(I)yrinic acid a,c-diamide adenosyltransferase, partial [Moorea sp. SIO3I7]|nr:cob(I)yrinic acid a,c-diamide adenosyltransferase [Moorena sp. SIO3I7]